MKYLSIANGILSVIVMLLLGVILWKSKKSESFKQNSPAFVDCNSNCQAFASNPTNDNLTQDTGIGSCADCLTDAYGMDTLPCDYVNNYSGSLNSTNFCTAYKDVMKNCGDSLTQSSWNYANQGMKCS